jgi:hypothetical protein
MSEATPDPSTAALPRVRPGRADQQQAALDTLTGRLAAIADLHQPSVAGLCACCLMEHPCSTYRLATDQ